MSETIHITCLFINPALPLSQQFKMLLHNSTSVNHASLLNRGQCWGRICVSLGQI